MTTPAPAVALHPSLRVARAFDEALTRASKETASTTFGIGALCAVFAIAEASGLSADPRVAELKRRVSDSLSHPREGEHVA